MLSVEMAKKMSAWLVKLRSSSRAVPSRRVWALIALLHLDGHSATRFRQEPKPEAGSLNSGIAFWFFSHAYAFWHFPECSLPSCCGTMTKDFCGHSGTSTVTGRGERPAVSPFRSFKKPIGILQYLCLVLSAKDVKNVSHDAVFITRQTILWSNIILQCLSPQHIEGEQRGPFSWCLSGSKWLLTWR